MHNQNIYKGEKAIIDYLSPEGKFAPLVELPEYLNPYAQDKVRIFAKLMGQTPLFNIKSYPAFNMLKNNHISTDTLIESSSGNTALSLTILGKLYGINNSKILVSNTIAEDKLNMLRVLGAEIIVNREPMCPDKDDPESGINKAKQLAIQKNWFNAGQYDNLSNPEAHYKWTGSQIWTQIGDELNIFVSALGTTGTMVGAGKFLKEKNSGVVNIGVVSSDDKVRLGPRTKNLLKEISFDWQTIVDETVEINAEESFKASMELSRHGLLVGPSSGFNYLGLLKYLSEKINSEYINKFRNSNNETVCVFICPDTPLPYINEYINNLEEDYLGKVINSELLENRTILNDKTTSKEITCESVYKDIQKGANHKYTLVDLRKDSDFNKFHIEEVLHIHYYNLIDNMERYAKEFNSKNLVFIDCGLSGSARSAVERFNKYIKNCYWMAGGMDRWTTLNLPVVKG